MTIRTMTRPLDSIRVRGLRAYAYLRLARPSLAGVDEVYRMGLDSEQADAAGYDAITLAECRMQCVLEDVAWQVHEEGSVGSVGMRAILCDVDTGWCDADDGWWCPEAETLYDWLDTEEAESELAFDEYVQTLAEVAVPLLVGWLSRYAVDGEVRS